MPSWSIPQSSSLWKALQQSENGGLFLFPRLTLPPPPHLAVGNMCVSTLHVCVRLEMHSKVWRADWGGGGLQSAAVRESWGEISFTTGMKRVQRSTRACKHAHAHTHTHTPTEPFHRVAPIHISLSCLSNPQKIVSGMTVHTTRTLAN